MVGFSSLNHALEAEHMFVLWLGSLAPTITLLFLFVWAFHVGSGTRMPNSSMNQLCHWGHLDSAAAGRLPKTTATLICSPYKRLQLRVLTTKTKHQYSQWSNYWSIHSSYKASMLWHFNNDFGWMTNCVNNELAWNNSWENNIRNSQWL